MPRRKPKEDLEAKRLARRALDLAAVNQPIDLISLPMGEAIVIERAGKRAKHDQARRADAFWALKGSLGPGHYDAVRRFERDLLTRAGALDRGAYLIRVDDDRPYDETDRIIMAGETVDAVSANLGLRDRWLLIELLREPIPERPTWRDVVWYVTGEDNPHAQAAAVRMACANLFLAYEAIDGKRAA